MANVKRENSKTRSVEAINTLINCFQSHGCIWNVTSGDYKDQNRKSLLLEEFDMSVEDKSIDVTIKIAIISEANSYFFRKNTALS